MRKESVEFKTAMIFGYSKLLSKKKCIFQGEGIMARTQTLQLQYLYTLNFHLMKVLYLILFNERLYKALQALNPEWALASLTKSKLNFLISKNFSNHMPRNVLT